MVELKTVAPLPYILGGWFTEFGVVTGFYFNKATKENEVKLQYYLDADKNNKMGC